MIQSKDIGKYVVYADGRIWSKSRNKFMSPGHSKGGYQVYPINGKTTLAHRLIAKALLPNPNNLPEINHRNGDKTDNSIQNLEWVSRSENQKHAVKLGLNKGANVNGKLTGLLKGRNNPSVKLTEAEARRIKYELPHLGVKEIASMFNIGKTTVVFIRNNKTWAHI